MLRGPTLTMEMACFESTVTQRSDALSPASQIPASGCDYVSGAVDAARCGVPIAWTSRANEKDQVEFTALLGWMGAEGQGLTFDHGPDPDNDFEVAASCFQIAQGTRTRQKRAHGRGGQ